MSRNVLYSLTLIFAVGYLHGLKSMARCPRGAWSLHGEVCYIDVFSQPWDDLAKPSTFLKAYDTCASYDGELPKVEDRVQNGLLRDAKDDVWLGLVWRSKNEASQESQETDRRGLHSKMASCKDEYCWTDDTPLGSYQAFDQKPPTNTTEQCVVLSVGTGKWYFDECSSRHLYWCQKDAEPVQQDPVPAACNGHGVMECKCEKGFTGTDCQVNVQNSRMMNRCWRFTPSSFELLQRWAGVLEDCAKGEVCIPDDLDCLEDKECPNPIGWCMPKRYRHAKDVKP